MVKNERDDAEHEQDEPKPRRRSSGRKGGGAHPLASAVASAASADALIDLVERLGLVDLVIGRVKSRIEEADLDEVFEEVADYMRRNPEVLVVSLGAMTLASALIVWLNNRREEEGQTARTARAS